MINEDELDDLRTGYAEWIETCAVANMSGITSPMIHRHHDQPADTVNDQPADTVNDQPADTVCMSKANFPPAIDDCLSCVRENVAKEASKDASKNVVIEIQGGGGRSESEKGGDSNASIARSASEKNNGKRSRKVTSDHSVKNDRKHGSGSIRRVYSLSEVLND